MTVHIGYTGSQYPMSARTRITLHLIMSELVEEFQDYATKHLHHGDCINGDEEAAKIGHALGFIVHAHPPFNERKRAFSEFNDVIHAPKDYIPRNHDIVDGSSILIATPHTMNEVIRSGTWATIRYARQLNRELCIIFPDGTEHWENSGRTDGREASRA